MNLTRRKRLARRRASDDDPSALDDRQILAARLRGGLLIGLAGLALFALADVYLHPANLSSLLALRLAVAVVLGGTLATVWRSAPRSPDAIAVFAVTAIYVANAAAGAISGEPTSTLLLAVVFAMATATSLPWRVGAQVVTVVVAAVVTLTAFAAATGVVASYPAAAAILAFAGSVYVAYEYDRRRRGGRRVTSLLDCQSRVLEMIALRRPLADVLTLLSELMERQTDGLLCSVLLLDGGRLWHVAAPSLPATYTAAVDGVTIGPGVGSCWTAAFTREPVIVSDIASDPLWADFRDLAVAHGLRACWSAPILATDGNCLGTFAMYYREPRTPDADAWRALERATHLAGIAIEGRRTEDALTSSRRELEEESQVAHALVRVGRELNSTLSTPEILTRLCELTTELVACECSDTVLRQADGTSYVPNSAHGYTDAEWESLRQLSMPPELLTPLLVALAHEEVVQFQTGDVADAGARQLLERYGITASMYVPLRRGTELIGVLSCAYRGRTDRFTPVQQRIGRGIAQLASLALENARLVEELRSASQLKSEFVSTMSHELRTPLAVILGYADMLEDDLPRQEQERTLAKIKRSGIELLEMIEATLNVSRLETGKDPPRFAPVRMRELADELAGELDTVDIRATTELRWDVADDVELTTDRRKLKIVVKNLVSNALKFTLRGEVVVSCRAVGETCRVIVRDTGVGIAPEHLPVIFEMFRQGDSSDSRAYSGVGLGLYIVRRLVAQLGGHVDVESAVDRGTQFTVMLPLAPMVESRTAS